MITFNGTSVTNINFNGTAVKEVCYKKNSACTKIFGTPKNSVTFSNTGDATTVTCCIHVDTWPTYDEYSPGYGDDDGYDTICFDSCTPKDGDALLRAYGCNSYTRYGCFVLTLCNVPVNINYNGSSHIVNNYGAYTACTRLTNAVTLTSAVFKTSFCNRSFDLNLNSLSYNETDDTVSLHGTGDCTGNLSVSSNTVVNENITCTNIPVTGTGNEWPHGYDSHSDAIVNGEGTVELTFTLTPSFTNTINRRTMTLDSEGRPTCDESIG